MSSIGPYRPPLLLSIGQLDPLLNNLVKICPLHTCRVGEVVFSFLRRLQESPLPVHSVYFAGSYLTHLFATSTVCNDIDMKVVIEGESGNASSIFHQIETIFTLALNDLLNTEGPKKNLNALNIKSFKPIFVPNSYSFKGYTLENAQGHLPFEISALITNTPHIFTSVMNTDSLIVPVYRFESYLGTIGANQFLLSSSQGECSSVIADIRNRILTANNPQTIQKFGWCRYLMSLIEGFTEPSVTINQAFYHNEAKAGENLIYDMHQFVQRKTQEKTDLYWMFFLCHTIFNCPKEDSQRDHLINHLRSLIQGPALSSKKEISCMHFLHQILQAPLPPQHLPTLLKLLIPLFSINISLKTHLEETWLQCELPHQSRNLFLLIPFLDRSDENACQSISSLLNRVDIPAPFECLNQSIAYIDPPPIFSELLTLEGRLPQEIALAWALRFPSIFQTFIKGINNSLELKEKTFPLLKSHLLLNQVQGTDYSLQILQIALNGCDLSLFKKEEAVNFIQNFKEKRQRILQCLEVQPIECFTSTHSAADFLLQSLSLYQDDEKYKIACFSIKQILHSYQNELPHASPFFWEKLSHIATSTENSSKNHKEWNQLLISTSSLLFHLDAKKPFLNLENPHISNFIEALLSKTNFSLNDEIKWKDRLTLFTLLTPANQSKASLLLLPILESDINNKYISDLQEHFIKYPYKDPFYFQRTFDELLEKKQIKKALTLLEYQKSLPGGLNNPENYIPLFCLALQTDGRIPSNIEAIESLLKRETHKAKSIWMIYSHLHILPEIASYIENKHLLKEHSKSYLRHEAANENPAIVALYKKTLILRMQGSFEKPVNPSLSLCLLDLQVEKEQILILLKETFKKSLDIPEQAYQIALLIGAHFNIPLDPIFLEAFSSPPSFFYAHRLILEISKNRKDGIDLETVHKYCHLFIEQIEILISCNPEKITELTTYYLPFATEEQRFSLAQKCCMIPSVKIFSLAIASLSNLKNSIDKNTWTPELMQTWISFLIQNKLLSEKYIECFLESFPSYASKEAIDLITKMTPYFTDPLRASFILHSQSQGNRLLEETKTSEAAKYLSFLIHKDISPVLLQNPEAYLVFLKVAQLSLQATYSQENLHKIIELLSFPLKFELPLIEESKSTLILSCLDFLSLNHTKLQNYKSDLTALFLEKLCLSLDLNRLNEPNWRTLCNALSSIQTFPITKKGSTQTETTLKLLAQKLGKITHSLTLQLPIIAECSKQIITHLLHIGSSDHIIAEHELLLHIHKYRLSQSNLDNSIDVATYCYFLEKTIVKHKFVNEEYEISYPLLCQAIKTLEKKNPPKAIELTDCLMNTIKQVCLNGHPGKNPFELALLGLEILSTNKGYLPVSKEFKTHQFASQLLLFALECPSEGLVFFDFFNIYMEFIRLKESEEESHFLKFNLYQNEPLFQGSISDFTTRMLHKALDTSIRLNKDSEFKEIDTVARLVTISYSLCPDYCKDSKGELKKAFVINALKCLLKFKDTTVVSKSASRILDNLLSSSSLSEDFVLDFAIKIAEFNKTTIATSYINIFLHLFSSKKISWPMVLILIKKIDLSTWTSQELGTFTKIYADFFDYQYLLHIEDRTRDVPFLPFADFYLQLIELSPKMHIAINLIIDVVRNTTSYSTETQIPELFKYITVFLKKVGHRISVLSYSKEDLSNGKVSKLISTYDTVCEALEGSEKTDFEHILDQIKK